MSSMILSYKFTRHLYIVSSLHVEIRESGQMFGEWVNLVLPMST